MEDIIIVEKPDRISYDEIYKIVNTSHEENRKNGILVNTRITNGKELKEHMGMNSICYVAIEDDKVVGTISMEIKAGDKWCTKNMKMAQMKYVAVLPEYSGKKIGSSLCDKVERYANINEADAIELYVVEKNPARHIYLHKGFEPVDYIYRARLKQNSVYMVKWLKKCKYPICLRKIYYFLKRHYIRIKYGGN